MKEKEATFVEAVAVFWESQGVPRIAGRILGLLLICDPPYRSPAQLTEELGVSKGSVSAMIRLLVASQTLEVVPVPGDRATYYQLSPASIEQKLERRLTAMVQFADIAEQGLELLDGTPPERRERLQKVADLYRFLRRELPLLLERWREEQGS